MDTPVSGDLPDIPGSIIELLERYSADVPFVLTGGAFTWTSPRMPALLGESARSLLGAQLVEFLHPDDHEEYAGAQDRVERGEDVLLFPRVRSARGHYVTVEVRLHPVTDDRGVARVVGSVRDITDTRGRRQNAERRQEALRSVVERAGDLLFVTDGNGIVIDAGIGTIDALGWLPEELEGVNLTSLVHPDQLDALMDYRREVQTERGRGSVDVMMQTRGGAWRWFRNASALLTSPDVDDPAKRRVLVTLRDIDSVRRDVAMAEHEANRLRRLLDSFVDPWMVLSPIRDTIGRVVDFRIDDANQLAADFLEWSRERIVGTHLLEQFPGVVAGELMAHYVDALGSMAALELEDVVYPHPVLGDARVYSVRARAIDGTLMLTWRDTTAASRARDELAEAEAHFRAIATGAGDALMHVEDGRVTWASPGGIALGLEPGTEFEQIMEGWVAASSQGALRTCGLTMSTPAGYAGRWEMAGGRPPTVVRAQPVQAQAHECVVVMIEERWTEDLPAGP